MPPTQRRKSAHSIYFQVLGEHGYVGLAIFLLLWLLVWGDASASSGSPGKTIPAVGRRSRPNGAGEPRGIRRRRHVPNLAHFDVPYDLLAAIVLTRVLIEKEIAGQTAGGRATLRRADPLVPQRGAPAGNLAPIRRRWKCRGWRASSNDRAAVVLPVDPDLSPGSGAADPLFPDVVSAEEFDLQMAALARWFTVLPLGRAVERLRNVTCRCASVRDLRRRLR